MWCSEGNLGVIQLRRNAADAQLKNDAELNGRIRLSACEKSTQSQLTEAEKLEKAKHWVTAQFGEENYTFHTFWDNKSKSVGSTSTMNRAV